MNSFSHLRISITERGGWIDSATGHTKSDRSLLLNGEDIHLTVASEIWFFMVVRRGQLKMMMYHISIKWNCYALLDVI